MEAPMSELGPEARAILDAGRAGDEPSAADRARMRARVMSAVAAGAIGPASQAAVKAGGVTAKGALPLGWKVLTGLAVLGLVGAGLLSSRARYDAGAPAPSASIANASLADTPGHEGTFAPTPSAQPVP